MEVHPDGPWLTRDSGLATVDASAQPWRTGTVEDEFTPIYLSLAQDHGPGGRHGPIPPPLVDLMDLTTIAALMGVGEQRQRQMKAHDRWAAPGVDPDVPLAPKARTTPE